MNSKEELLQLANATMPFGKYKGRLLIHLPEDYLVWMKNNGMPAGKLGQQLAIMLEIKSNGLEQLIYPLIQKRS